MESYISLNTELRRRSCTDFHKDFFKLMNNAVIGKTMENVRKRINIRLIRSEDEEQKLSRAIAKPMYERSILYDNDFGRRLCVSINDKRFCCCCFVINKDEYIFTPCVRLWACMFVCVFVCTSAVGEQRLL